MALKRLDIFQSLFERLKKSSGSDLRRGVIFGLPDGHSGSAGVPVAVTLLRYVDLQTLQLAKRSLPYGLCMIGLVDFETEDDEQDDLYAAMESLDDPIALKVIDGKVSASTGLDFSTNLHLNVINSDLFWEKTVTTFHVQGKFLIYSQLEIPDLKDCFAQAKVRVLNQTAYVLGKKVAVTLLPRHGHMLVEKKSLSKGELTVGELIKGQGVDKEDSYFRPGISLVSCQLLFDQTKSNSIKKATLLISDTNPRCKLFEHYLPVDFLVVVPNSLPAYRLYKKLSTAFLQQLEFGFHENILQQLCNSISAEKPEAFHFWPSFAQHFVTAVYPDQTSEEKLKEIRLELHDLFYIKETRPYFRRPASLFQTTTSLISPHLQIREKTGVVVINGHYEYKHYMQDHFNDDGWGCAYRSLQTIVSWFRLQGFTSMTIPTHKEIQECLVSLGDKPGSFVGSKQWIGSTEVSFVLEALLGVSCRILSMSSGSDMSSRETLASIGHHFRANGTPLMVGGGVYAHTIIGVSEEDTDSPSFLILDPHWTGGEDLKIILSKGWVGWKDKKFWSPTDFYNVCMPILPATI